MKAAMQSFRRHCAALATTACFAPVAAWAGPPFLADDPEPTETGHWETYAFADSQGRGSEFGGSGGVEINYGAAPDLQLTLAVPAAYAHDDRWHSGMGDIELAANAMSASTG